MSESKNINLLKATGIVRRIDELGRIVIPKEIRRTLRLREGDPVEIYNTICRQSCKNSGIPYLYYRQRFRCRGIRYLQKRFYRKTNYASVGTSDGRPLHINCKRQTKRLFSDFGRRKRRQNNVLCRYSHHFPWRSCRIRYHVLAG